VDCAGGDGGDRSAHALVYIQANEKAASIVK
jgi:hypothetical protein